MAIYNTGSDSANTMVRAFLTKIGESYLNHSFNTGSGKGKEIWQNIKDKFENKCAFCGEEFNELTIEHLIMFNRTECGLHHPGNVVPSCKSCNKRTRDKESKKYVGWEEHLKTKCDSSEEFNLRKEKISSHINSENYPNLTLDEKNALKAVAESLYERISNELPKSIDLFKKIDSTLVKGSK